MGVKLQANMDSLFSPCRIRWIFILEKTSSHTPQPTSLHPISGNGTGNSVKTSLNSRLVKHLFLFILLRVFIMP